MSVLKIFLTLCWLVIVFVTVQAFSQQGMIAGELFVADIQALNWRAQFNVDFLAHLLLLGSWVFNGGICAGFSLCTWRRASQYAVYSGVQCSS